MNMKTKSGNDAPNPQFSYQGAYLPLGGPSVRLGPFAFGASDRLGVGYAISEDTLDDVPVTAVRTASTLAVAEGDPADNLIHMGFDQNDVKWQMAFSVLTDKKGGLVGCDFALDVQSNFPQLAMSVARTRINQPGMSVLTKNVLPGDYRAQMTLRFWGNGNANLPLDAWIAVQVAYVKIDPGKAAATAAGIPLVTTGEMLFYPAPGSGDAPVLCDNYPAPDRFRGRP